MVLLDSNIVIYLLDVRYNKKIINSLGNKRLSTCNVVMAEVLGYNALEAIDARYFSRLFSSMRNHMFDQEVTKKVIEIRKAHSIQLPDAIIAATAVVNNLTLWTHNTHDFSNIEGLQLFDPLQDYLM